VKKKEPSYCKGGAVDEYEYEYDDADEDAFVFADSETTIR